MLETDFTRNRKQSFHSAIVFMINFLTKSLSVEITNFISFIKYNMPGASINGITKSAFVQYRKKIKPEVFKSLSDSLIEEFYTDNDASIKLWNGFRLLAIDGSRLVLPDTQELESIYGKTRNQSETGVVQARISVLYDVLNRFAIDGVLAPLSTGESVLALNHLVFAKANDLIIYDRGYPSFNLIYEHFEKGVDFLIRVKADFSNLTREFYQSGLQSAIARMQPGKNIKLSDKPYSKNAFKEVRLVRVELPDGEIEILITSLFDSKKYPVSLFKELYFLRWGVETFYDELKNKIKIEHFSGYSEHCILQDFYAALFVSNVQSLIVGDINDELAKESTKYQYQYQYKVNSNLSYGFLKDRIILLFFSEKDMDEIVSELKALFKKHTIPIRPNRRFERDTDKYRKRGKPKLLKNNKNTF
ncbi:IS4 family transposase [Microbacter margulisiae]|nr:IS4 family transposase [Microbacter margulisiae]